MVFPLVFCKLQFLSMSVTDSWRLLCFFWVFDNLFSLTILRIYWAILLTFIGITVNVKFVLQTNIVLQSSLAHLFSIQSHIYMARTITLNSVYTKACIWLGNFRKYSKITYNLHERLAGLTCWIMKIFQEVTILSKMTYKGLNGGVIIKQILFPSQPGKPLKRKRLREWLFFSVYLFTVARMYTVQSISTITTFETLLLEYQ